MGSSFCFGVGIAKLGFGRTSVRPTSRAIVNPVLLWRAEFDKGRRPCISHGLGCCLLICQSVCRSLLMFRSMFSVSASVYVSVYVSVSSLNSVCISSGSCLYSVCFLSVFRPNSVCVPVLHLHSVCLPPVFRECSLCLPYVCLCLSLSLCLCESPPRRSGLHVQWHVAGVGLVRPRKGGRQVRMTGVKGE